MSSPFVILHLSDAHLGQPRSDYNAEIVFKPLFADLELMRAKLVAPSLIVFTGDLAFGNVDSSNDLSSQYAKATTFLDRIYAALSTTPAKSPLLLVPGNHDVDRKRQQLVAAAVRRTINPTELQTQMYDDTDSWRTFLERQQAWSEFVRGRDAGGVITFDEKLLMSYGVMVHEGVRIGVAGLNTSWSSIDSNDHGSLWLGQHQYDVALAKLSDAHVSILATHHPMNSLNASERNRMAQRVQSDFRLHCHGHEHSGWLVDSVTHVRMEGGALYESSDKPNGYSWLSIDFAGRTASAYMRKFTSDGKHAWGPHVINGITDSEGHATIKGLFDAPVPSPSPAIVSVPSSTSDRTTSIAPPRVPTAVQRAATSGEYIALLVDMFDFTWEPRSHTNELSTLGRRVFWPVRLRVPTPIHAAQCFAAAGLQQRGCEIHLWLDNLGNKGCEETAFIPKILAWMDKAGGKGSEIIIKRCDADLKTKCPADIWAMTEQWLGTTHHKTIDVLRISKIISSTSEPNVDDIMTAIRSRKPRSMMTPAIVWSCLLQIAKEDRLTPIITLGGFDERELWAAWHQCCGEVAPHIANLYLSELKDANATLRMAGTRLDWPSKQDVMRAFRGAFEEGATMKERHRVPCWALSNCALLPTLLSSSSCGFNIAGRSFQSPTELASLDATHVEEMAAEVWKWLA